MLPAVQLGSGKEGPGNATADASILDVIARSLFRRNRSGYVRPAFRSSLDTIAGNHGAIARKHGNIAGKHGAIAGKHGAIAGFSHQEARRNRQEARKDQAMQRQTLVYLMLLPDHSHGAISCIIYTSPSKRDNLSYLVCVLML